MKSQKAVRAGAPPFIDPHGLMRQAGAMRSIVSRSERMMIA